VELGSLSHYCLENLLLVADGFLLLKLNLIVLLIVSKHVLWPKVTPKSLGWIMAKMASVRLFIVMAALQKWPLYQLDVKNTFLNGDLQEEIYMEQPPGFVAQGESSELV